MPAADSGGRYEILRSLGRGAMGEVYLAHDRVLNRPVAIKQVRADAVEAMGARAVERMMREARLAARLRHPHIVTLFDIELAGTPRMIMEFVDGESLQALVKRAGPMDPSRAAAVFAPIAAALAAAHDNGITHRDVKPANVLLGTRTGEIKLADFGVAVSASDVNLTEEGQLVGTLAYMAPEAARTGRTNSATDVWSLGASLYAVLEGRAPHVRRERETYSTLVLRIVTEPAPPAQRAGPLTALLTRMLDADPAARPDAAEVARELTRLASGPPPPSDPRNDPPSDPPRDPARAGQPSAARPRRRKRILVGLAVLVLAAAGGAVALALRGDDSPPAAAARANSSFTADGAQLWMTDGRSQVVVVDTGRAEATHRIELHHHVEMSRVLVTPAQHRAYVLVDGKPADGCVDAAGLAVLDTDSYALAKVVVLPRPVCAIATSSDGDYVLGVDAAGAVVAVGAGGASVQSADPPSGTARAGATTQVLPVPDTDEFVTLGAADGRVLLWSAASPQVVRTFPPTAASYFDIAPDGSHVYIGAGARVSAYPIAGGAATWTAEVATVDTVHVAGADALVVGAHDNTWTLTVLRASDGHVLGTAEPGGRPSVLRLDLDRPIARTFYSTGSSADRVDAGLLRLSDGTAKAIDSGARPLVVSPDGDTVYAARHNDVTVVAAGTGRVSAQIALS